MPGSINVSHGRISFPAPTPSASTGIAITRSHPQYLAGTVACAAARVDIDWFQDLPLAAPTQRGR